ncbi:MAG: hypothetical protein CM1200mP18_09470 [Gammaproteobacteria bacterium]|nr:MAG: hypothetical protein CM1200mP18_09470 [Gammaproteobacteria bacterium]
MGFDTVDVEACKQAGIAVGLPPNGVRGPVAVSVLSYILALSGKLMIKDALVRGDHQPLLKIRTHGHRPCWQNVGFNRTGNIGAEIFRLCAPLGMNLIAHDPYIDPAIAQSVNVGFKTLKQYFVKVIFDAQVPLNEETHHLVNAARLALMNPTAYLINTSRARC